MSINEAKLGPIVARVAALTIYPLKSAAGIEVTVMPLDGRGAVGDRRWLLIDYEGCAITARECHALLRIQAQVDDADRDGALTLSAAGYPTLRVEVPPADAPRVSAQVWDDTVLAYHTDRTASEWCREVIGRPCTLVRVGEQTRRPLQPRYAGPVPYAARDVAFSDGAPLMMLGLPSIAALNARLLEQGHPETMDRRRFRANVWLDGLAPHEEDTWRAVQVGEVACGCGTLCARCVLTTVHPDSLARGDEPLRTFASYRRRDGGVMFGVNATHAAAGTIRVGDVVRVSAHRDR